MARQRARVSKILLFSAGAVAVLGGHAAGANPSCIEVAGEAIYRSYGYDHIVHVRNRCERQVACDVSTDVNPEPQHIDVPARTEVDVLTFRGSPARAFTPRAACRISR